MLHLKVEVEVEVENVDKDRKEEEKVKLVMVQEWPSGLFLSALSIGRATPDGRLVLDPKDCQRPRPQRPKGLKERVNLGAFGTWDVLAPKGIGEGYELRKRRS